MALPYVTLANLKSRLGITNTASDQMLGRIVDSTNAYIESVTGRAIGSNSVVNQYLDGWDALEGGTVMPYPQGIRSITALAVATHTGGDFVAVASNDVYLQPSPERRTPGWPALEMQMTDIPSSGTTVPYFPPGFQNIRLSADIGWAAMPEELREAAELIAVRSWMAHQAGQTDMVGTDEIGQPVISRHVSARDRETILRYRWRSVEII